MKLVRDSLIGGTVVTRTIMFLAAPLIIMSTLSGGSLASDDAPKGTKIRIGTYDSRAIAIAYVSSRFNPVKERMADYEKAKAAGDKVKMKELESWGEEFQRQLDFQGFGRVPVDDLLAPARDQVSKLGRERQLAAITMSCDFTSGDVELVDVTDDLVKLYAPTEKTLEHVRAIRKVKPTPLTQLRGEPGKKAKP